jgi:predicted RecB family nuclease
VDLSNLLAKSLTAYDNSRERSTQVEIGPSQIGGCRRQVYHQLVGTPETNPNTEALAAILGTFIHAGVAEAIKREDPFGDNFLIEQEFVAGDLKGHVDLYIKDQKTIVDWKTTKLKSLRFFPSTQQRLQVQIYGYLLTANGYEVENVALVAIPRDGEMAQIKTHIELYDPEVARQGLAWLEEVKQLVISSESPPAPEKDALFCVNYCSYYDATGELGCPSTRR